jgi:hypothetical protein
MYVYDSVVERGYDNIVNVICPLGVICYALLGLRTLLAARYFLLLKI